MGPLRHPPQRGLWEKDYKRPLSSPRQTMAPPRAGDGNRARLSGPAKADPFQEAALLLTWKLSSPRPSPKVSSFLPKEALDTALHLRAKGWLVTGQQLPWRLSCPSLLQVRLSLGAPLRGIVSSTFLLQGWGPLLSLPPPPLFKGDIVGKPLPERLGNQRSFYLG